LPFRCFRGVLGRFSAGTTPVRGAIRVAEDGEMTVTLTVGVEATGTHGARGPGYRNEGYSEGKEGSDCDRISDHDQANLRIKIA
jgi:hypothetical protein